MLQLLQSLKTGETELVDVPAAQVRSGSVLIQTHNSLVSAGTERMLVDFGKASYLKKARQQPEKVKMVIEKIKTDGLMTTIDAVKSKLDQLSPMGYCNVGKVVELATDVSQFALGDRVVSNGHHSEIVCVPKNLCAKIPETVSDQQATFTVLGAIALQGIRLVNPTLGETIVVSGLGMVGLLTVQLLRANGCRVIGLDFNQQRLQLAESFGAEVIDLGNEANVVDRVVSMTKERGIDGALITASTKSSEPVHHAAQMCRKRGRIVLVGVTGLELSRNDFYEKELSFQVSCSYGPGRYDENYELKGQDYPIGFVRWTEQRNFEAVLAMMADGKLDVEPLISHQFQFTAAAKAYDLLTSKEPSLGILLNYPKESINESPARTVFLNDAIEIQPQQPAVAFIGAGNYAGRVLIPAFKNTPVSLVNLATSGGVSGVHYGKKFGFQKTTTDTATIFQDDTINTVVVATRHNTHAGLVCQALENNKHVFVEKPLCMTDEELSQIESCYREHQDRLIMVGFNRRFAPHIQKIKSLLSTVSKPKAFIMTVNAGDIPADHWVQDKQIGGGRVLGEACHFIDLLRYLAQSKITHSQVMQMGGAQASITNDKVMIQLQFADGSIGTIHYLANGHKAVAKERLEIFCDGRILQLDNFRKMVGYGWPGFTKMKLARQDKGQNACVAAFVNAIRTGGSCPILFEELVEVSQVVFNINREIA